MRRNNNTANDLVLTKKKKERKRRSWHNNDINKANDCYDAIRPKTWWPKEEERNTYNSIIIKLHGKTLIASEWEWA